MFVHFSIYKKTFQSFPIYQNMYSRLSIVFNNNKFSKKNVLYIHLSSVFFFLFVLIYIMLQLWTLEAIFVCGSPVYVLSNFCFSSKILSILKWLRLCYVRNCFAIVAFSTGRSQLGWLGYPSMQEVNTLWILSFVKSKINT